MQHSTKRAALAAAVVVAAVTATALPAASAAPAAPRTAGASVTPGGTAGNAAVSAAVISRDGKVVAFDSEASDLVAGDTGGRSDVFVRTLATGRTERVALPGRQLRSPSLSGDGRYVAVITAPAGDYGASDVRLYDRTTKKFQRLDVELPTGFDGTGAGTVALTPDARYAAFDTRQREGSDGQVVFLRDRKKKTTERISHPNPGWEPRSAHSPTVSDDGRKVVYAHNYTNGPRGDDWSDVWLHDRATGRRTQVDRSHDGSKTEKESLEPSLSGDGRKVVFESRDTHLVPNDDDKAWNVFVHDLASGRNQRVHGTQGGPGAAYTRAPAISADGRRLTYMTEVKEPGSQYGTETPVYVRDLKTGRTVLVTPDATGGTASAKVTPGAISANGKRVAFLSADAGLLPGDTNDGYDAFVRYLR